MKQKKKTPKATYYNNKEMAEKLSNEYETFKNNCFNKRNLKILSDYDCEQLLIGYENELFSYEFAVWEYEIRDAIRDVKREQNDIRNFKEDLMIIEEVARTPLIRKKVNYKISETTIKMNMKSATWYYNRLVDITNELPTHRSKKRQFPLKPPEEPTDTPQE